MPDSTTNYGLATYNASTDQSENFLDYRTAIAGVSAASNMSLIDDAMNDNAVAITALEARKNIVAVSATYDSPNTYLATVSAITAYTADDVIALKLDTDSDGTVTLNINSLGAKSVMKIDSSATAINLAGSDMRADREYNCKYDGARYVWMDATAADQINVNGTSGNLTMINSDNELEDSTVAPSDLATTELDNLGTVAINTDLASDTDDTDSLGTATKAWKAFLGYATRLKEKASAAADVAGWGEIWVKSDTPNTLWFTDDAGTDVQLGVGGGIYANAIINGDCSINQRETAFTLVKDEYCWDNSHLYGPDRFEGMATGTLVSAGTFGKTEAANAGVSGTAFKFDGVTLTGTGILYMRYRMEAKDAKKFKNQTASFSSKVHQDTGGAIDHTVFIRKADSSDDFSAVTNISNSGAVSIPDSAETSLPYSSIAMGDCSNGIEVEIKIEAGAITTKNFELTELKFEIGDTATAFEFTLESDNLTSCKRYYERISKSVDQFPYGSGVVVTAISALIILYYDAKRDLPNITFSATSSHFELKASGTYLLSSFSPSKATLVAATLQSDSTGMTAGEGVILRNNSTNTTFIAIEAEL